MDFAKSDLFAEKQLKLGGEFLKKGDLFLALIAYNKAICYANSKQILAIAYVNRSAIYRDAGMFEESLKSIQFAREHYSEEKIQKLNEREEKCKKLVQENADKPKDIPDKFFQLSYPPSAENPNIAGCLELRNGKYFTTRDLKPGDVILIGERKKYLPQPGFVNQCYSCFKVNAMNLIPSLECAVMMFCSVECRDNAPNISDAEARENQKARQKYRIRLVFQNWAFDRCPIYWPDEKQDNISAESHFTYDYINNTSYFHFDGIKEVFYITKSVKAGEKLTANIREKDDPIKSMMANGNIMVTYQYGHAFDCGCFHCKLKLTARQCYETAGEMTFELLTATELVEKLTENWQRIQETANKKKLKGLIEDSEELMQLLAIKKTYLPKGRYCICRTCALKANDKIFDPPPCLNFPTFNVIGHAPTDM